MVNQKKVAIVYDWIDKWGGVERVLLTLHEMFPDATFYTSYYDKEKADWAKDLKIKTSFLQNFPSFIKNSRILSFIFYPFAFESFDFSEYDLVISITSSFAKAIITKPGTRHICYLLTPTRYLWSHERDYLGNKFIKYLLSGLLNMFKNWDKVASQRPDKIISISETVRERCKKYYNRDSEVIYPGFDEEYWNNIKSKVKSQKSKIQLKSKKFFLVVSRLEPYKKIDLALQSFNRLKYSLVIVGKGSQKNKLKQIAGKNIIFLSKLSDIELGDLYSKAQALIMPQEEDFGYVSLESQFFNCPVIAYKKGGAVETIIDRKTGLFFEDQTEQSLCKTVERFNKIKYNLKVGVKEFGAKNVEKFSKAIFIKKIQENL
ncbi:Glycosyltransferase family 4 protein [Candidatus Roizmanbacteria bacterium]|nr:Glycosyltransferase family 4 protein [Candidatus Roizmanbacteria bacterium]